MNKATLTLAGSILAAFTATAVAETGATDSDSFVITGEIANVCLLINNSIDPISVVSLDTTDQQVLGSYTYRCTNPGGFDRVITSANNGVLNGPYGQIDYHMSHGGGSGLSFSAMQLTSPRVDTLAGSNAFAAGQTGAVRFHLPEVPGGLMAGDYSDDVTFEIFAN